MSDLYVIVSDILNPYENLALEKFLLENVQKGKVFLYLWQNEKTVVCGRNQDILSECNVERLTADGGYPARRLSGGGCVYHDKGNLNFTFIACEDDYDLDRQLEVIIKACGHFGISAQKSGRNDLLAGGAKFSGNAFYRANPNDFADKALRRCHHGTLMVDVDKEAISAYLNVDKEKYESKGVSSVKSRVCNLKELNPEIDIPGMKRAMARAFEEVYKGKAGVFEYTGKGPDEQHLSYIKKAKDFFASKEWIYKNSLKYNVRFKQRFDTYDIDLRAFVEDGQIKDIWLFSDAMDHEKIIQAGAALNELKGSISDFTSISQILINDVLQSGS